MELNAIAVKTVKDFGDYGDENMLIYYKYFHSNELYNKPPMNIEIKEYCPRLTKLSMHKCSIKLKLLNIFWYFFSENKYKIIYAFLDKELVHYSYILTKNYKFPFMKKEDIFIGPCYTMEKYRGKGIYPFILNYICENKPPRGKNIFIVTSENNISSQRGIIKANFTKIAEGYKTKLLGIYKLTIQQ